MGAVQSVGKISICTIREDAKEFSRLHSWNKHLRYGDAKFLIAFGAGMQVRNALSGPPPDPGHLHLHLVETGPNPVLPRFGIEGQPGSPSPMLATAEPSLSDGYMVTLTRDFDNPASDAHRRTINEITEKATHLARRLNLLSDDDPPTVPLPPPPQSVFAEWWHWLMG
jgi:hypothetical protein